MRKFLSPVLFASAAFAVNSGVSAEIYKCTDAEGNIEYQQLPCPEPGPAAETETENDEAIPETVEAEQVPDSMRVVAYASSRLPGEPVEDCKKRYRDQIDEIDAEILVNFSPEMADDYKARLRVLTGQLRACE